MHELISVVAFFAGVPIFIIGWVMSIVAAKQFGTKWIVGMVLLFPVTLLLLVLIHWGPAKKPLLFTVIGTLLILVTIYYVPEQETVYYHPDQQQAAPGNP
jgi:hypothetical protein